MKNNAQLIEIMLMWYNFQNLLTERLSSLCTSLNQIYMIEQKLRQSLLGALRTACESITKDILWLIISCVYELKMRLLSQHTCWMNCKGSLSACRFLACAFLCWTKMAVSQSSNCGAIDKLRWNYSWRSY